MNVCARALPFTRRDHGSMTRYLRLAIAWASLCLPSFAPAAELTVSAAASLKDALTEIASAFHQARADVSVVYNFGGSGQLQHQLEHGAPADVYLAAAPRHLDALEAKGLLKPGSRRDLLGNALVLIAPRGAAQIRGFADLVKPEVRHVMIAEPKFVPAGAYSAQVFAFLKIAAALEPKLVRALDVRQVLASVATGNVDAGMVYRTDAQASDAVRVVAGAPPGSHAPIVYPVAALAASREPAAALAFVDFLSSLPARDVFTRRGFVVLSP